MLTDMAIKHIYLYTISLRISHEYIKLVLHVFHFLLSIKNILLYFFGRYVTIFFHINPPCN